MEKRQAKQEAEKQRRAAKRNWIQRQSLAVPAVTGTMSVDPVRAAPTTCLHARILHL